MRVSMFHLGLLLGLSTPLFATETPIATLSFSHSVTEKQVIDHFPLKITIFFDGFLTQADLMEWVIQDVQKVAQAVATATSQSLDDVKPSERNPESYTRGYNEKEERFFKESYVFELKIPAGEDPVATGKHVAALARQLQDLSHEAAVGDQSTKQRCHITLSGQTGELSIQAAEELQCIAYNKAYTACIEKAHVKLRALRRDPRFFHVLAQDNGDHHMAKSARTAECFAVSCSMERAAQEITLDHAKEVSHTETISIDVGAIRNMTTQELEIYYGPSIETLYRNLHPTAPSLRESSSDESSSDESYEYHGPI